MQWPRGVVAGPKLLSKTWPIASQPSTTDPEIARSVTEALLEHGDALRTALGVLLADRGEPAGLVER